MAIPNPTLSLFSYVVLIAFQISLKIVVQRLLLMILFGCLHSCILELSNHSRCSSQQTLISLWRMLHGADKCKLRTLLSVNTSEYKYSSLPLRRPAKANSPSLWGVLQCSYHQSFLQRHLICNHFFYEPVLSFRQDIKQSQDGTSNYLTFPPRFIFCRNNYAWVVCSLIPKSALFQNTNKC